MKKLLFLTALVFATQSTQLHGMKNFFRKAANVFTFGLFFKHGQTQEKIDEKKLAEDGFQLLKNEPISFKDAEVLELPQNPMESSTHEDLFSDWTEKNNNLEKSQMLVSIYEEKNDDDDQENSGLNWSNDEPDENSSKIKQKFGWQDDSRRKESRVATDYKSHEKETDSNYDSDCDKNSNTPQLPKAKPSYEEPMEEYSTENMEPVTPDFFLHLKISGDCPIEPGMKKDFENLIKKSPGLIKESRTLIYTPPSMRRLVAPPNPDETKKDRQEASVMEEDPEQNFGESVDTKNWRFYSQHCKFATLVPMVRELPGPKNKQTPQELLQSCKMAALKEFGGKKIKPQRRRKRKRRGRRNEKKIHIDVRFLGPNKF